MTGSVYRIPLTEQPRIVNSKNYILRKLQNTNKFCKNHFNPPNYPELQDIEISRIIDTLNKFEG